MGMLAFGIDLGWVTHTHNELQAAADAAALAGAGQLTDDWVRYYLPGQSNDQKAAILAGAKTRALTAAQTYAGYNSAGDVASLNLPSADVEFGFTDSAGNYTALPTDTGYPNTVKVVMRRDSTANGLLPMFFARVIGISSVSLTTTATAGVFSGTVDGFNTNPTQPLPILPMTYDVNHWNNFIKTGQGPDGSADRTASGDPQLAVYPSIKFTGNFGELSLDQGNDGASTISGWIDNRVPGSDLQAEYSSGLLPLSQHNPNSPPDWKGNPGLKDSTIHTVDDHIGATYLLPLFKPVLDGLLDPTLYAAGAGQGANYYYTIVAFVAVKITSADDKTVKVQPTALINPNVLYTNVGVVQPPSGTTPTLATNFVGARLLN
jgi:hypothetical protein